MTRFYTLDDANALLPELESLCARLLEQRRVLVDLRDDVWAREAAREGAGTRGGVARGEPDEDEALDTLRLLNLRMRGLIDQMQAEVAWLDERSIVLRDIATGLLDFPALVAGRQVWLCWRSGEREVGWWHELTTGVAGRRPLAELE